MAIYSKVLMYMGVYTYTPMFVYTYTPMFVIAKIS